MYVVHLILRSWRVFIEPIKAFYLMNDQTERKKEESDFLIRESTHIMWIKSV